MSNGMSFFELDKICLKGDTMEYDNNPSFRITKGRVKGVFCDDPEYGVDIDNLFEENWRVV